MSSENKDKNSNEAKSSRRKRRLNGFEQWGGYMAAKIGKLNAQFDGQEIVQKEDEQRTEIFKGVAIFVNGYTKPPADELKRLMGVHGGVYHHYYSTTKTTHVVASNLPYSKMKNLKTQTIVTVDWITDSIKAGKLLPHQDFLLYTPEAVDKQKRLQFKKSDKTEPDKQSLSLNENESSASFNTLLDEYDENFEGKESDSTLESEINFQEETGPSLTITSPAKSISGPNSTSPQKRGIAVKAGHPDFLSEFYNNSRLHHISTASQELKRYVQSLAESNKERHFPGRARLKKMSQEMQSTGSFPSSSSKNCKVMMHLDMDCFFVSVGLKKHPELRGLPVAVSHSKGRSGGPQDGSDIHYEAAHYTNKSQEKVSGLTSTNPHGSSDSSEFQKLSKYSKEYGSLSEIASCSYEARKAGLRNGMLLGEALRRCPDLKTIPYDFEGYSEVSKQLYNIVASYTLDIEAVSCDELYIDCTRLLEDTKLSADQFATALREEIQEKTGCTASAGLGPNMLIARLANKVSKPNGQFYVRDSEIDDFIKKQKVADLPGVGYTTSSKFKNSGILTCADLQTWSLSKLQQELGPKNGQSLYNRCRGKDDRVVQMNKSRKSVSAEINYGIRFETLEDANNFISELSVEVQNRLQSIGCKGRALTLKLMARRQDAPVETAKFMGHGICDHFSKSVLLKSSTDNAKIIASECVILARTLNVKPHDYRGIGIQMSKLEEVKKETSTLTSFLNKSKTTLVKEENLPFSNGVFCPKNIEIIDKPIPENSTLKHFLNKPSSPHKPAFNANDYLPDQLDQSVLDALPDDLRKEVLDNYHASKESTNNIFPSSASKKDPPTSSELNQSSNNTPEVNNMTPNVDKGAVKTLLETPSASLNDEPDSAENIKKSKEKASLGGEVDVDEIKKLLHEWVNSTQEPLEEDMDDLKKFLMDAIDEDLGKVNLLLEFFYKLVAPLNKEWKTVYQTALYCVQQKVLQVYGSILDASTDFPT